jgi:hypothetical protein
MSILRYMICIVTLLHVSAILREDGHKCGRNMFFADQETWYLCSLKRPIHSQLNWEILLCDVIPDGKTELTAQFWQAITQASELSFPVVFHTENCSVHSGNPTVSSVYLRLPTIVTRRNTHRTDKKTDKPDGKPVLCQETFSSVFRADFYTFTLHSLTESVWGP